MEKKVEKKDENGEVIEQEEVVEEVKKNTIDYTLVDNDNGSYTVRYKVDVEVEGLKIQVKYRN